MENHQASLPSRKRRRLCAVDYTVACFVAIEVELTAMRAMLDAIHQTPDLNLRESSIAYTCGEIGSHNVVLAVLPRYGSNDSGVIANQLKNDFPSVKNGLLVGIAGGIPDPDTGRDVRLGDVVVSDWKGDLSGVVQFDRGKHEVDGFKRTGSLNYPSDLLLTTLKNLQSRHNQEDINLSMLVNDMLRRSPSLSQRYSHPPPESDQLYIADYEHSGGVTCQTCDSSYIIERGLRADASPRIHYGTFGSSNTVLRNGNERERLRKDIPGLLAVEMEAAGLLNVLSCIVIKGVCDYADSHKNNAWQPYAAAVAAAYAKALLSSMPGSMPIEFNEHQLSQSTTLITTDSAVPISQRASKGQEQARYEVLSESLTFNRMDARLRNVKDALPKTCKWVRDLPQFRSWSKRLDVQQHKGFLWIKGKPGCGKSTIMKTTHAWAKKAWKDEIVIAYFFNARAPDLLEKSSLGLYRSLTYQLLQAIPSAQHLFVDFFATKCRDEEIEEWTEEELQSFWSMLIQEFGDERLNIFIDALDEGNVRDVRQMVSFLEDLTEHAYESKCSLRICLSSRHYPEIRLQQCLSLVVQNEAGHDQDIEAYVKAKLWIDNPQEAESLRQQICDMSSHVFLWVVLVIEILNGSIFRGHSEDRRRCLEELPKGLDGLFERIVSRDDIHPGHADIFLRWILFAERPLSQVEIYLATTTTVSLSHNIKASTGKDEILSQKVLDQFILDNSRGLAELTRSSPPVVQFIHETVRTFLLERGLKRLSATGDTATDAQTHDLFVKTCLLYLSKRSHCIDASRVQTDKAQLRKDYAKELLECFPFLEYASAYLFTHAENAQRLGLNQETLLGELSQEGSHKLAAWIKCRNCFQKYVVHQYKTTPPLLYIFAESNLPLLCALQASRPSHTEINKVSDARYGTALQAACAGGHAEIAQLLVSAGADVNVVGGEYEHALFAAMFRKRYDLMDWLVQQRACPEKAMLERRLFIMITRRSSRGVHTLLELGASISCFNKRRETPVYYAASRGCSEQLLSALIEAGADVNLVGGYFGTALQAACYYGHLEVVRLLLDAGADVDLVDRSDGTALQAASYRGYLEIVRLLLDAGADVNLVGRGYGSALQAASVHGYLEVVRLLLHHQADVNIAGGTFGTALKAAQKEWPHDSTEKRAAKDKIVDILIEHGALPAGGNESISDLAL